MKTLILGAYGQVGQELFMALASRIGSTNIVCADIKDPPLNIGVQIHERVDAMSREDVDKVVQKHAIKQIYCLTALLSAKGEVDPLFT